MVLLLVRANPDCLTIQLPYQRICSRLSKKAFGIDEQVVFCGQVRIVGNVVCQQFLGLRERLPHTALHDVIGCHALHTDLEIDHIGRLARRKKKVPSPRLISTTPSASRILIASRTELLPAPIRWANSSSVGRRCPGLSSPVRRLSTMRSVMICEMFRERNDPMRLHATTRLLVLNLYYVLCSIIKIAHQPSRRQRKLVFLHSKVSGRRRPLGTCKNQVTKGAENARCATSSLHYRTTGSPSARLPLEDEPCTCSYTDRYAERDVA